MILVGGRFKCWTAGDGMRVSTASRGTTKMPGEPELCETASRHAWNHQRDRNRTILPDIAICDLLLIISFIFQHYSAILFDG